MALCQVGGTSPAATVIQGQKLALILSSPVMAKPPAWMSLSLLGRREALGRCRPLGRRAHGSAMLRWSSRPRGSVVWLAQMVALMPSIFGDHSRTRTGWMWRW